MLSTTPFKMTKYENCLYSRELTFPPKQEILDSSDLETLLQMSACSMIAKRTLWMKEKMLATSIIFSPFPTMFSKAIFFKAFNPFPLNDTF